MRANVRAVIDRVAGWPLLCSWMLLIFALSSIPNQVESPSRLPFDKVAHVVEFAVLAALAFWIAARARWRRWRLPALAAAAIVFAVAYGGTDEVHQVFVPGRDPSWTDLAADALGAAAGAAGALFVWRSTAGHV
jgi:VanZ family protein